MNIKKIVILIVMEINIYKNYLFITNYKIKLVFIITQYNSFY